MRDRAFRPRGARWLIIVLCLAAMAAMAVGCGGREEKKDAAVAPPQTPVTTAPVQAREVVYTLEQVGSLAAGDHATLRAQVAGVVAAINFKEGSAVKKDEVLVLLDDAKIQAQMRNLQARLEQLQVRLGFQRKTLERNQALLKKSAIAQHQFDQILAEVKETELGISQVRADLSRQREMLTYTVIRAPFDGVVGSKNLSVGDYLKVGDAVVDVVVLDPLEISFQVPERYKAKLSPGQKVSLRVAAHPEQSFEGTIFFISPTVDVRNRAFLVKARVENARRELNPGMFARVSLVTDVHPQGVVVPWESVIQTEDGTFVYMLDEEGAAKRVAIKLGKATTQWAEVLDPALTPGALVIVEGKFAARDGAKVAAGGNQAQTPTSQQ